MPLRRTPMARRVPISRVRSTTAMLMALAIDSSTMASTTDSIRAKIMSYMPLTWRKKADISCQVRTSRSRPAALKSAAS
jgi:hypothetical protein